MTFELPEGYVVIDVDPDAFSVQLTRELLLPFFEDEDGNGLYGYGHQNVVDFIQAVYAYDKYMEGIHFDPVESSYSTDSVQHLYGVAFSREIDGVVEEDWRFYWDDVTAETPHSFPVTVLSR